jgi:hypothetical protein
MGSQMGPSLSRGHPHLSPRSRGRSCFGGRQQNVRIPTQMWYHFETLTKMAIFILTMLSIFARPFLLCALFAIPSAATAATIFSDDFSANTPAFDSPAPLGWQITNGGRLDILGECNSISLEDLLPGNNCYIDLDGNPDPILPTVKNALLVKALYLPAGHAYTAYFSLAGNQTLPFPDTIYVDFGTISRSFSVDWEADFSQYSISFVPPTNGTYNLSFINSNIDGAGALLDNVVVDQVPGPLPILGAATAFGFSRRLRARLRRSRR